MFKMLEKLINEHGSASILKERLGLKDDQIASLQNEFATLIGENDQLKLENSELKTSLAETKKEITRLEQTLESYSKKEDENQLSENELKILRFLFENNREFRIEQIAQIVSTDTNTAKYYVNSLQEKKLLYNSLRVNGPTMYRQCIVLMTKALSLWLKAIPHNHCVNRTPRSGLRKPLCCTR